MARLGIRIAPPNDAIVGRPFDVIVEVTASAPTKINQVAVRLIGRQGWTAAGGYYRRELVPDLVILLEKGSTLRAGVNMLVATFKLGEGPPSHELDPAWARYELYARVSAGWWRGGVGVSAPLQIRAAPLGTTQRYPIAARTSEAAPLRLEVSLASSRVVAGETVHGRCAVHGLPDDRPRELELSLEPVLVLKSNLLGNVVIRHNRFVTQAVLPQGTGGTSVPFTFTVPEHMTPTFKALSHELWRELVISTGHLKLTIPLEVLDPSIEMPPLPVAPLLGGEVVGTVFEQFANARSWRRDDHGTSLAVTRAADDIELRIECEYRGKDGAWLVARVTYPSLGLGLEVTPASLLRNVLGDVAIGDPDWDRAHDVQARSPEQARPFVAAVAPATMAPVLGMMLRWTDDSIVYEQRVDVVEEPLLAAVADALATVSRSIEEHRAVIDASPGVDIDRERIRALALELRGRLAFGNLAITGWLGGLPVAIRTQWERVRATRIVVVVGSAETATELARMVDVTIPRPAIDAPTDPEAKRLVGLATWQGDIIELRVTGGVASAELLLDASAERVAIDVDRVRQLVEALHAIRVALEPASGPYR